MFVTKNFFTANSIAQMMYINGSVSSLLTVRSTYNKMIHILRLLFLLLSVILITGYFVTPAEVDYAYCDFFDDILI
jgi:hypothetical protein